MKAMKQALGVLGILLASLSLLSAGVTIDGRQYVSLRDLGKHYRMGVHAGDSSKKAELRNQWARIEFEDKNRDIQINGTKVYLTYPIRARGGQLYVSAKDANEVIRGVLSPKSVKRRSKRVKTIVIDPGHGGKDPGAKSQRYGIKEKHMALDVSKRVKRILEGHGYRVHLTRDRDIFIPLKKRPEYANAKRADLFVSVHFNAVAKSVESVSGMETYRLKSSGERGKRFYLGNRQDESNVLLAYSIQSEGVKQLRSKDRGVKSAAFGVLKHLKCPGVLVECGFMTNTQEAAKINQGWYREQIAESIAGGILNYHKRIKS